MRRALFAIALLTWLTAFAATDQPATQPQETERDGRWLREGIHHYQRLSDKSAPQSVADASEGVGIYFYIRGVLDALWSAALKAKVQEAILANAEKSSDPEVRKSFARLAPQRQSATFPFPSAISVPSAL